MHQRRCTVATPHTGVDRRIPRRREISRTTKNGLDAARKRGRVDGRSRVTDDDKRAVILARREKGQSIRVIARVLDVSVGTVHTVLTEEAATTEAVQS
ncbi:helix-turn-helix domain-containing protein [Cryobacterium tagatosivorans]|uniref:Transposase IS30-like HTH domain-containing protein n=1 Tax=Cryobacterium tagatosivorans TaxID=1259199 RepID=A0A4R8UEF4_9MICO|nr:sigma factor-like helix-turn-helix DNA-binding protein [Cryobacterium tagatosivorans]TFB51964.1 hypothetical protein E3O23_07200 [Cryobacterium tagatosivorans]